MKTTLVRLTILAGTFVLAGLLWGCQSTDEPSAIQAAAISTTLPPTALPTSANPPPASAPTQAPPPTPTSIPTMMPSPTPLPTSTPIAPPTATPIGPCEQRIPDDGLLTFVTLEYGLSRDFVPDDLVPLADYLPVDVTLGYPTELRQPVIEPLVEMIKAMHGVGLRPFIVSGYRSYSTQAIAWDKWNRDYPERAAIISSPPGHSEHQLGTTIDFGSPELADIVGEEFEFHTYFYKTGEGDWLLAHAHEYGFTLSYSREAFELTGFYYEPWHYRYVGVELATRLFESGSFLAQYLLDSQPLPCVP